MINVGLLKFKETKCTTNGFENPTFFDFVRFFGPILALSSNPDICVLREIGWTNRREDLFAVFVSFPLDRNLST